MQGLSLCVHFVFFLIYLFHNNTSYCSRLCLPGRLFKICAIPGRPRRDAFGGGFRSASLRMTCESRAIFSCVDSLPAPAARAHSSASSRTFRRVFMVGFVGVVPRRDPALIYDLVCKHP